MLNGETFLVALLKEESEQTFASHRTRGATSNGPFVYYALDLERILT